ncbi:arsenate reductase ArsC [Pyruvatibacter mobilis]|uniref:Arsenate reductase ArsC n=2 Tax=Pyruvatibacter mobilis TaxID=1712261 RepID=A0A845Q7B2_9HYPH|nr:arsenate reductase ArsC [Pyruvatibacter mobilis]QJD76564.1 arsenate reductase ArsC [Pyruvatibacter mobilis]
MSELYNVLFLCTGNSARSIMGESILNRIGKPKFRGYSAGSHPKGQVNPYALDLLRKLNYPTGDLRSKDWNEFSGDNTPKLDFVFTLCDSAAGELCPAWPGQPMTAHWGFEDPAAAEGSDAIIAQKFAEVYGQIERRLQIFTSLPISSLDKLTLQKRLDDIGRDMSEAG